MRKRFLFLLLFGTILLIGLISAEQVNLTQFISQSTGSGYTALAGYNLTINTTLAINAFWVNKTIAAGGGPAAANNLTDAWICSDSTCSGTIYEHATKTAAAEFFNFTGNTQLVAGGNYWFLTNTSISSNRGQNTSISFPVAFKYGSIICTLDPSSGLCNGGWYIDIANLTVTVDTNPTISINLTSPGNGTVSQSATQYFVTNSTVTHGSLVNSTLYVWFSNGTLFSTNTTVITGTSNTTNSSLSNMVVGGYVWNQRTYFTNTTGGNISRSFATNNFTYNLGSVITNLTYNASTYETGLQSYTLYFMEVTGYVPSNGKFWYAGTSYSATITQISASNYYIQYNNLDIPTVSGATNQTLNFTWNANSSADGSSNYLQLVDSISLDYCQPPPRPFLNFTFRDEVTNVSLNALNPLTSIVYWIGGGGSTKTLTYSNATNNSFFDFCLTPANQTINTNVTFKYSNTAYPVRTFTSNNLVLDNHTTNYTLYMLSSADGIYTTIEIINSAGAPLSGVDVLVERQFSGVWTTIGHDSTGSDGAVTFWVDPNFPIRITATKSGYTTGIVTITPTQSIYTMTLASAGGSGNYTSDIPGILYVVYPHVGSLTNGSQSFNATVTANFSNLENCKFELLNGTNNNNSILSSATSITNSSYCQVALTYAPGPDEILFGRLSVDTTNTTGFVILDSDFKWVSANLNINEWRTIRSFFSDFVSTPEFGGATNEGTFTRLVIFFILLTVVIGVFNYVTGIEVSSPGASMLLIWGIVALASAGGFLTLSFGSSNIAGNIMQKWGIFLAYTMIVTARVTSQLRRDSE